MTEQNKVESWDDLFLKT